MKESNIIIEIQSDAVSEASVRLSQFMASLKNEAIRNEDRMRQYRAWVDPEAIRLRQETHDREAAASLAKAKEMSAMSREAQGLPAEDPPLPEIIPKHMRGQSHSTIRAMLRQENWEYDGTLGKWSERG